MKPEHKIKNYLIDIDGVLANYAEGFTRFFNTMMATDYKPEDMKSFENGLKDNFKEDESVYEEMKTLYRKYNFKRTLLMIPGYQQFRRRHKKDMVMIWTSRAVDEHDSIEKNTRKWLEDNKIYSDHVIFLKNQYKNGNVKLKFIKEHLSKETTDNLSVIDDDIKQLREIAEIVPNCYLFTQPYNVKEKVGGSIKRINSLRELS